MSGSYNFARRAAGTLALMKTPDLFVNVHKGIRHALFQSVRQLGRKEPAARQTLLTTLRFVAHHGENEDVLLIPLARARAPELAARMEAAHAHVNTALLALQRSAADAELDALCTQTNRFLAAYLAHMDEEENVFDAELRAALTPEDLAAFGKQSVERTAPADQLMMLGFILPSMPRAEAELFLGRVPPATAATLRAQLDA